MGVSHIPFDLRPGHQGRHRVDDDHVDGVGAHQRLGDLQSLLAGVRLAHQQAVHIHPQVPGVHRVQGVLHVDKGGVAPHLLSLGDAVQGQGGLTGRLGPVDLHNAPPGQAPNAQGQIQGKAAGGHGLHVQGRVLPQAHDGPLAVLFFDLGQGSFQGLGLLVGTGGAGAHRGFVLFRHGSFLLLSQRFSCSLIIKEKPGKRNGFPNFFRTFV